MTEREELEIELAAIEGAMDRALYRVEWEKLKAVQEKLNKRLKEIQCDSN